MSAQPSIRILRLTPQGAQGFGPAGAARALLVTPGALATAHSVTLPAAGEAQLRAAARFAVEDELAAPADSAHLALGQGGAGAPRLVATAAHGAMAAWLAAARAAGIAPDAAAPEWACVPAAPDECAVLVQDGLAHGNIGGAWGFSAEPALAALLLPRALERFGATRATLWGEADELRPASAWAGRPVDRRPAPEGDGLLMLLAEGAAAASVNLLQGPYAPRRARGADLAPWRRAAALAGGAGLFWLGLVAAETAALDRNADALRAEAAAILTGTFPDEARVVNPAAQMQARLAALRGRGGAAFLDLAALLAQAAQAQEGVEIAAMRWRREDGALGAELVLSDYGGLAGLRAALEGAGAVMDEGASRQTDGFVSADITVRLR